MENEQHPQQNKKQRNRKTNKIILSVIGGVVLLIIIISVVANAVSKKTPGNSGGSSTPKANTSQPKSTPSYTAATPQTPSTTPSPQPSCYTASQAANEEGQTGCVQFTGYAYTSDSGQIYLDQSLSAPYGFSVWIPAGTSGGSSLINEYSGKNIDVTGSIVNYNGEPEIEVTSASQIQSAN